MNFRNLSNSLGQHRKSPEDLGSTLSQLCRPRKTSEDFGNLFFFSRCKSILGYGVRFDGEEGSSLFSWGGWGSSIILVLEKFRSREVGISVTGRGQVIIVRDC